MNLQMNYLTDRKGLRTAVQLPIKDWEKLMADYIKLKQYNKLKKDLSEAFLEINEIEQGKKNPVTLKEFLNEL